MNVFVLDLDHEKRAEYHCDNHVNKMLLESVQILNTALHKVGAEQHTFYKETHSNHPWCEWAAESNENWRWLVEHTIALSNEFESRNGKRHKSAEKLKDAWLSDGRIDNGVVSRMPNQIKTKVPLAMPDEYKTDDPVESYRRYYAAEKYPQDWCSWSNGRPEWLGEYL